MLFINWGVASGVARAFNINMECRSRDEVQAYLWGLSKELGVPITDPAYAAALDSRDPLARFRDKFCVPSVGELLEGKEIAKGNIPIFDTLDKKCTAMCHNWTESLPCTRYTDYFLNAY